MMYVCKDEESRKKCTIGNGSAEESGRHYMGQKVDETGKGKVSKASLVPDCV